MRRTAFSPVALIALPLALGLFAADAVAESIVVSATQWGRRSKTGAGDTDQATASSWWVGRAGGEYNTEFRAYWGFPLPELGTITGVTLNLYTFDVNYQDLSVTQKLVYFRGPDTYDGVGPAFTFNDLAGPAVYTLFDSRYIKRTETGTTICGAAGQPGCLPGDSYTTDNPIVFSSNELEHVNAVQGGTFWLSALMALPGTSSEALLFIGSSPGNLEGTSTGDYVYLNVEYTPDNAGVPEPGSWALLAVGIGGITVARKLRRA